MTRARLLLADDHSVVAAGLAKLLADDFDVIGVLSDGRSLVEAAERERPDVIVSDLAMPQLDGFGVLRELASRGIEARVVMLSMHADAQLAVEAFRLGAQGYLLKAGPGEELIDAVRAVAEGRAYLATAITRDVLTTSASPDDARRAPAPLTRRQREVVQLIAEGKRMKEIAVILGLSRRTVESHKYEAMRTLGLRSTAELIRYTLDVGAERAGDVQGHSLRPASTGTLTIAVPGLPRLVCSRS